MELLKRSYVKYALIMCGVIIACLVIMELTNSSFESKSPILTVGTIVAPFIIWFLGIREKKRELKGKMTFKQGLTEGFKISLVFGIVSPFIFLIYYFINPDALLYAQTTYQLTQFSTTVVALVDMLVQFVSAIVFGTIYAAIISFFLKSK